MNCLGLGLLIIGLIVLAFVWPPMLIIYLRVGGIMLLGID